MPLTPSKRTAAEFDLAHQLELARQEADYFRDRAKETGRSHLWNLQQLSGLVAELRQTEQRLRESEERYRHVAENLNAGMLVTVDQKTVFANAAVAAALERSQAEPLSTPDPFEYIHPDDREMVIGTHFKRLRGEPVPESYCFRVLTKSGAERWVEVTGARIDWMGRPAVLNFFVDATARIHAQETQRKLEQQLVRAQKMEALGAFAGGIAHDFNNRMAAVLAYVSLVLCETDPSHPHYSYLASAEKQIREGSKLTRQLLGYVRNTPYQLRPIALNWLVREVSETFGRTHKAIGVHLELSSDLCSMNADPFQIEQALLNLFVNAADAMPEGGALCIATRNTTAADIPSGKFQPKPGDYVALRVADYGVGMSAEIMDRIFDPFFTTKEPGRGTGLGLESVFGIVKGHNGYIDVASQAGRGAAFSLYFPACSQAPVDACAAPSAITAVTGTALVVDDEEVVLETSARMLVKLGFTVLRAGGGGEAIDIFRQQARGLGLVVLDLVMPGIGGEEVYRQIKAIRPDTRVLISSGFDPSGGMIESLQRDRDGFLRKPFTLGELSEKVQELLRNC